MRKTFGLLISLIALAGMSLGFWILYKTEIRLMNSVPVNAVLVGKSIEPASDASGQYFARARYKYYVDGDLYFGRTVMVYDFSTPVSDYVAAVIDPLKIDSQTIAYHNKYNPQDSFLTKSIPYPPYAAILGSLIIFITGIYLFMTPGNNNLEPVQMANGWFWFKSDNADLFQLEKATYVQALVFSVISILTFANYFYHAVDRDGISQIGSVCAFLLLGSLLWKQAIDAKKRADAFDELHLEIESESFDLDKEYKAKIKQKAKRPIEILKCNFGVLGHKSSVHGPVENENWYENIINQKIEPKDDFKLEQNFCISSKNIADAYSLKACVYSDKGMQEWSFPVIVNTELNSVSSEPK